MSKPKRNITKTVVCPRCAATVHRNAITEHVTGQQVDVLAYCEHCGHYWCANRTPKHVVKLKRRKS